MRDRGIHVRRSSRLGPPRDLQPLQTPSLLTLSLLWPVHTGDKMLPGDILSPSTSTPPSTRLYDILVLCNSINPRVRHVAALVWDLLYNNPQLIKVMLSALLSRPNWRRSTRRGQIVAGAGNILTPVWTGHYMLPVKWLGGVVVRSRTSD